MGLFPPMAAQSLREVSRQLGLSSPAVGYSVERGEVIAVVQEVLKIFRLRKEGQVLLGFFDVRGAGVDELARSGRVSWCEGIVHQRDGEKAKGVGRYIGVFRFNCSRCGERG